MTKNRLRQGKDSNSVSPIDQNSTWWRKAVIYEVAPISFQDTNGDGKGDLEGLAERLGYLQWLGVNAIWLTPIYPSPMLDFGYDISDFCDVDPTYGDLATFDRLLTSARKAGIRLILDFVPNHTSDQHPWFIESRSSRGNPCRDWYVWADPASDGGPPNNWLSRFGGSAWTWDQASGQYYYHAFLQQQPDLNWRNPKVRAAMADVLRFWMRRGVEGFRVDASAVLAEDELLRDEPPDPEASDDTPPPQRLKRIFTDDRPESMTYLEELRGVIDEFDGRMLAGEVQGKVDRIGHFYGKEKPRLHLPLNFGLLDSQWDALSLQANIDAYFNHIPAEAWPCWVIGGHDKKRATSKIGQAQARNLAMLLMTLKGTPFLFAGDEIGMDQVEVPPHRIQDPFEKLVGGYGLNRDGERVPMRWDGSSNGGFTTGRPWLPMGPDVAERNVERSRNDRRSLLWLYRQLIALRKSEVALMEGSYQPLRSRNDVLLYLRVTEQAEILIALNLAHEPRKLPLTGEGTMMLSTHLDRAPDQVELPLILRSDEGVIVRMMSNHE
jgi:alpha-glucosidase